MQTIGLVGNLARRLVLPAISMTIRALRLPSKATMVRQWRRGATTFTPVLRRRTEARPIGLKATRIGGPNGESPLKERLQSYVTQSSLAAGPITVGETTIAKEDDAASKGSPALEASVGDALAAYAAASSTVLIRIAWPGLSLRH